MSMRLKLSLLVSVLLVFAILNSLFIFQLETYSEEKLKWVNHTNKVLYVTERLLGEIKDAETGQRGYLLTTNQNYLEPYHSGVNDARASFEELKALTADNPSQGQLLEKIAKEMELKFAELGKTVALETQGNHAEAIKIVTENRGKHIMDNIRSYIATFTNTERVLLEKRKGDFREYRAKITTLVVVEVVIFIALAVFTFSFLHNNFFTPLKFLMSSVQKIESGNRVEAADIVSKDEMGRLLTTFFTMSEKVFKREQELNYIAHYDELTGLKNRLMVRSEIEEAIDQASRDEVKAAVIFLDLNKFKQVNDTLGHDVGDHLLIETAKRLSEVTRDLDTVFRIGGDEFMIIARDLRTNADTLRIMEKILKAFDEPAVIKGNSMAISISMGVATTPDDSSDYNELIKFSDIAMYAAKQDGETSYKCFSRDMLKRNSDE